MDEQKNLPVDWAGQMAALANAEAKQEQPEIGTFSFKAGIMTFGGMAIPGSTIDVVVLGTLHENRYFPEEFDEQNIQPPLCWAFSDDGMEMVPDVELVTEVQSPLCGTCPQFQWGSDPKGRGGKACKSVRRFICIPASELENVPGAHLGIGTLSTTNVRNWSSFVNTVAATMQRPSWAVVAKMTCQPDARTLVKVTFDVVSPIPEEKFAQLIEKRGKALEFLRRPYDKRPDDWNKPKEPARRRKF